MEKKREEEQIVFHYEKHPDYKIIYANGAYGGVNPRGDFRFELFTEYKKTPAEIIHSLTPDGLGPEIGRNPSDSPIVRELQIGIIMTLEQAKSLAHWILAHINEVEKKIKYKEKK